MVYFTAAVFGLILTWGWTWLRDRPTRKIIAEGERALEDGSLVQAGELFLAVLQRKNDAFKKLRNWRAGP